MTAQTAERESTLGSQDKQGLALLGAALRAIGTVNDVRLCEQNLTVTRARQQSYKMDFAGRVPFGFSFTAGHDAAFHVPCGYRFWIEHITVSIPTKHDTLDVQMVTHSRHLFQQVSLQYGRDPSSDTDKPETGAAPPILVPGPTANTLLFSNGMEYGTSTVPSGAYVQMWGSLEPTDDPARA